MAKRLTIVELSGHWWYRLLKVFYFGAVSVFLLVTVALFYEDLPKIDVWQTTYTCKNIFPVEAQAGKNEVQRQLEQMRAQKPKSYRDLTGEYTYDENKMKVNSELDCFRKFKAAQGFDSVLGVTFEGATLHPIYTQTWLQWFGKLVLSFVIGFMVFELIRRIFFYVVTGETVVRKSDNLHE